MPIQDSSILHQLRNNVEFASVSQFLHTFQSALEPSRTTQRSSSQSGSRQATPLIEEGPFDTEVCGMICELVEHVVADSVCCVQHFEQMLLDDGERYRLEYLIIRLLKVLTRNRLVRYVGHGSIACSGPQTHKADLASSSETWQLYLIREFYKREPETNNPFYQQNYWPFPMSKTKLIYDSVEPTPKDDDDGTPLSDNEVDDHDKSQVSTDNDVKKEESEIKTEEQTPEIEAPLEEQPDPINFFDLDLDTKVHVLYILCEVLQPLIFEMVE